MYKLIGIQLFFQFRRNQNVIRRTRTLGHSPQKYKVGPIQAIFYDCLMRILSQLASIFIFFFKNEVWSVNQNLADLFIKREFPTHIRSDNGPEFIAKKRLSWFKQIGIAPVFIEPGSPWENGYCESFNGKMRYELQMEKSLIL